MKFNLNPSEQLIAIFRKHPFFMWITIAKYIFLAILPVIVIPLLTNIFSLHGYGSVLLFGYLIILWVLFFIEWTDFILDTWILTNERLIDVEQIGLFSRRVSTLTLDRIQDVTAAESGLIETFFGIGIVVVQSAGQLQEFRIYGIKDPNRVKEIIQQTYRKTRQDIIHEIVNLNR